jgi:DNA-binding HxlR family transcriptional regulator
MDSRALRVSDFDVLLADCSARTTLEMISGTWMIVVLVGLAHGPRRYSELLVRAGGISRKMLTETLGKAVDSGLVARPSRRGSAYALTPLGESLLVPLTALTVWAEEHVDEVAGL